MTIRAQYVIYSKGLNVELLRLRDVSTLGKNAKIAIPAPMAITPNSLWGIALKIAYQGKKYHSGTICVGVDSGFALI